MLAIASPELDNGPRTKSATMRLCAVSREVRPVDELIRFVLSPEGEVVPDLKRKLPGRGVWVSATRGTLAEAVRRSSFQKGFEKPVKVAADLVETTEHLLQRSALDALAIAGKAREVVTGFAKVEAALQHDQVKALLHASDAAADGVNKINSALRRRFGANAAEVPVIDAFSGAQLDLALGRSNVVHAALLAGPASDGVLSRCRSLEHFRTIGPEGQSR